MRTRRNFLAGIGAGAAALATGFAALPAQTRPNQKVTRKVNLPTTEVKVPEGLEVATLAGGCFWCTEAIFLELKGVDEVVSGYSGGYVVRPSYKTVCTGTTGHAEAIQILFDPEVISYKDILDIFLVTHDPTTLNRQGADVGTQYRSAIFTHSEAQAKAAKEVIKEFEKKRIWNAPIVTEITPFSNFYPAEDYHQNYFARNGNEGYCRVVIAPKVAKFRQKYFQKLKK